MSQDNPFAELSRDQLELIPHTHLPEFHLPEGDIEFKLPPVTIEEFFTPKQAVALAETIPEHVRLRGIDQLRDKFDGGKGVKFGIADTGISFFHIRQGDLKMSFQDGKDFTNSKSGLDDLNGHGTHCYGIIAADSNNGVGTSSVLPNAKGYVAKVLGDSGAGASSSISAGLTWLADQNVDFISLSLGGGYSKDIHEACLYAWKKGIPVVAAIGNEGTAGGGYPAKLNDATISIAAVDFQGGLADFSSRDAATDFAAYGVQVYSTYKDGYAKLSGTSMATPEFAGAIVGAITALEIKILGKKKVKPIEQWIELIKRFTKDVGPAGHDIGYGWGVVDFATMIVTLEREYQAELQQPVPVLTPRNPTIPTLEKKVITVTGSGITVSVE